MLSGGGAFGAYQVGAISELCAYGRSWDRIVGVSVGALNGALMAHYAPLDQNEGARRLRELWTKTIRGTSSIYVGWRFGVIDALVSKGSMNDAGPLLAIIRAVLSVDRIRMAGVEFHAGAVDLCSGEYRLLGIERPDYARCILASAAFPAAFPPVALEDGLYVDGGIVNVTPLESVIADPRVTEIDVVMCSPITRHRSTWDRSKASSVVEVGKRCAEIMAGEIIVTDTEGRLAHPKVRHVVYPHEAFEGDPLDFDPAKILARIAHGERDARAAIANLRS